MGRPGTRKEQVADAAFALRAAGKPTTTRAVRLELGTGSNTTIGRFLDELGAKSGAKPSVLPSVPQKLQRQFANALYNIWEASSKAAAERSDATEAQCAERIRALSRQLELEREDRKRSDTAVCSAQTALSESKHREHLLKEEVSMLREALGIEKALHQRAERERNGMLQHFASRSRKASNAADEYVEVARQASQSARKHVGNGARKLASGLSRQAK